ncbi:MAG TPA: hypothetical protein VJK90_13720 [Acetobacteraceae bacterium]|jgi:hypothetical protein|nr:hypothetical protein [Acetobacteraceae bacterium]
MTEIVRLDAHDPLPEIGSYALVIRRFGEDDPNAVVTEIDFFGRHGTMNIAVGPDGLPVAWEAAVQRAQREANARGYALLYAVDRTTGRREQQVLRHHGDHSFGPSVLADTDEEDGVHGSSLLDRPPGAGFMR